MRVKCRRKTKKPIERTRVFTNNEIELMRITADIREFKVNQIIQALRRKRATT